MNELDYIQWMYANFNWMHSCFSILEGYLIATIVVGILSLLSSCTVIIMLLNRRDEKCSSS